MWTSAHFVVPPQYAVITDRLDAVDALATALRTVDEERATLYSDLVCAALPGAARRYLEGRAEGEVTALLAVLAARRIDVPEDARARITSCTDTETLTAWFGRAATAERIEDVLG